MGFAGPSQANNNIYSFDGETSKQNKGCKTWIIRHHGIQNESLEQQIKTQIRIYLRDEAIQKASEQAASTGKNISETIEQFIMDEADNAKQTTNR